MSDYLEFYCPYCGRKTKISKKRDPLGKNKNCRGCQKVFVLTKGALHPPVTTSEIPIEPFNFPNSFLENMKVTEKKLKSKDKKVHKNLCSIRKNIENDNIEAAAFYSVRCLDAILNDIYQSASPQSTKKDISSKIKEIKPHVRPQVYQQMMNVKLITESEDFQNEDMDNIESENIKKAIEDIVDLAVWYSRENLKSYKEKLNRNVERGSPSPSPSSANHSKIFSDQVMKNILQLSKKAEKKHKNLSQILFEIHDDLARNKNRTAIASARVCLEGILDTIYQSMNEETPKDIIDKIRGLEPYIDSRVIDKMTTVRRLGNKASHKMEDFQKLTDSDIRYDIESLIEIITWYLNKYKGIKQNTGYRHRSSARSSFSDKNTKTTLERYFENISPSREVTIKEKTIHVLLIITGIICLFLPVQVFASYTLAKVVKFLGLSVSIIGLIFHDAHIRDMNRKSEQEMEQYSEKRMAYTKIDFSCRCGESFSMEKKYAGNKIDCPSCGYKLVVPKTKTAEDILNELELE